MRNTRQPNFFQDITPLVSPSLRTQKNIFDTLLIGSLLYVLCDLFTNDSNTTPPSSQTAVQLLAIIIFIIIPRVFLIAEQAQIDSDRAQVPQAALGA